MNTKMKKLALATAVGLALSAGMAQAGTSFKNNGTGAAVSITNFNADAGNYLLNDFSAAGLATTGSDFALLGQTVVGNWGAGINAAAGFEYTLTMAIRLSGSVTSPGGATKDSLAATISALATPTLSCTAGIACDPTSVLNSGTTASVKGGSANYFQIFYGAKDASDVNGTGFNNGTLILQGHFVVDFAPPNETSQPSRIDITNSSSGTSPAVLLKLDNTGNAPPPPAVNVASIQATGSSNFNVEIDYSNAAFFPNGPTFLNAAFIAKAVAPQLNAPNTSIQPPKNFNEVVNGVTPAYGTDTVGAQAKAAGIATTWTVNNWLCGASTRCDFSATGTSSGTFDSNALPEPGSLALMGLGLGFLGYGVRRRKTRI